MARRAPCRSVAGLVFVLACAVFANVSQVKAATIGARIYNEGIGQDGKPIQAHGVGGTVLSGAQAACANCHKRSGYGSSEGGMLAPPIIGKLLFKQRDFHYRELERNMKRPITRPAYTRKTLTNALHSGMAANGKMLRSLMPRYTLSRSEIKQLEKYLKDMGKDGAIGVDKENIYLASVVTPDVPEHLKQAMRATLEAYVKNKNAETREEHERAVKSPWHRSWKYEAYRRWKLQIWELKGEPSSWKGQLEDYYARRPVFAMVSGIGTGTWQPIHDFCELKHLPCLFPSVANPGESPNHYYSVYFSKGIRLQSRTIAKHLLQTTDKNRHYNVIQIVDHEKNVTEAAAVLSKQLAADAQPDRISLKTVQIESVGPTVEKTGGKTIIVSWVPASKLGSIDDLDNRSVDRIYLPSFGPGNITYQHEFDTDIYVVSPYTLPVKQDRSLLRVNSWTSINHVSTVDKEITANTYYTMTLLTSAIKHLRSNFSRDYMIERIEHMLDNNVFTSVYPHLSLGPDQRFASKGCYVVGPLRDPSMLNTAKTGEWIVP